MKTVRRLVLILVALGIAAAIYVAMQPQPIRIDIAQVTRGNLRVTVDEDGITRVKERYVVSAPLAGRLLRINIDPGDLVEKRITRLATIEPSDPQLLNPRELLAAEAREKAAEAAVKRTDPLVEAARAELNFAESDLARKRELRAANSASESVLQDAQRKYHTSKEAFRSATFSADIARFELEQARAALLPSRQTDPSQDWTFHVYSPIGGRVLRVNRESSGVVAPGEELLEIGDANDIELKVDVLSSDAVKIQPDDAVVIEHWGGDRPLRGIVRLVEPSAVMKISALGVEEQRVDIIIDILNAVEERPTLGDGYRVEVRIVVWEGSDVLQVPASSLFRDGDDWLVFAVREEKAVRQVVQLGHRNGMQAELLSGLSEGDIVIVHPSDEITDGVTVLPR